MRKLFYIHYFSKNPTRSTRSFFVPLASGGILLSYFILFNRNYLLFFYSEITLSHPLYNRRAAHTANYFLLTVTQVITCAFAASRQLQNHLQHSLC